ncbi:MAG: ABC transporter permease subunit, partial [bacterium]
MRIKNLKKRFQTKYSHIPLLGWFFAALLAVILEHILGPPLAMLLYLPKIPALFGCTVILKEPYLAPSAIIYVFLIYLLPVTLIGRLTAAAANRLAAKLLRLPCWVSVSIHLILLYVTLHIWSAISDYRIITLKLTLIAIILTLSLNIINGYMGEFSCSHPGFMALGAYAASVFTVVLFAQDKIFGAPLLPPALGPVMFPCALIVGGLAAAPAALIIAIPSFRTRGDYLAIISLAFMFIVKSAIENLEIVGGPRGLSSQPNYAGLPTVFLWTVACIWIINNFVSSTLGKAVNAVRD